MMMILLYSWTWLFGFFPPWVLDIPFHQIDQGLWISNHRCLANFQRTGASQAHKVDLIYSSPITTNHFDSRCGYFGAASLKLRYSKNVSGFPGYSIFI